LLLIGWLLCCRFLGCRCFRRSFQSWRIRRSLCCDGLLGGVAGTHCQQTQTKQCGPDLEVYESHIPQ
jgi:hypothetical protein